MLEPPATGTPFEFLLIGVIAGSISITAACLGLARWLYVKYNSTIEGYQKVPILFNLPRRASHRNNDPSSRMW